MKYYFLKSKKHGYVDIGLFQSKYTAMSYLLKIAKESEPGITLMLKNSNDVHLGSVKTGKNHKWYWTLNLDK